MRFVKTLIVEVALFTFLLSFLVFTQQLPTWISDWQKTLLNNGVIFTTMGLMILAVVKK